MGSSIRGAGGAFGGDGLWVVRVLVSLHPIQPLGPTQASLQNLNSTHLTKEKNEKKNLEKSFHGSKFVLTL